ncbi:MAG: NAD-dependent epimerase/dehydratase family protein [Thermohalobaculum sp.]
MSGPTLVTGAGGFLGGHVVAALAYRGEAVRALDIAFPAALPEGVERIDGSILDAAALAGAMAGAGAVIHCAAIAALWEPSRWAYDRVNMRGTCEVLIAARRAGARVVQVSSYVTLIGGPDKGEATLDETVELTPTDMLGPHPRSKREAELAALCAVRMGQEVVIVQPSAPVGPGDHRLTPPSRMIRDLAAGKTAAVLDCLLNLVDVRALAGGVIAARDKGRSGERYLLTGEDLTMVELAAKVAALAGVAAPRFRVPHWLALAAARIEAGVSAVTRRPPTAPLTGVRLAGRRVRFDNAKARGELGFAPPPVDQALADAVSWMRETGLLG